MLAVADFERVHACACVRVRVCVLEEEAPAFDVFSVTGCTITQSAGWSALMAGAQVQAERSLTMPADGMDGSDLVCG